MYQTGFAYIAMVALNGKSIVSLESWDSVNVASARDMIAAVMLSLRSAPVSLPADPSV